MSDRRSEFERETGTTRATEEWARVLARDTAMALGYDYCVVKGHPQEGECLAFPRSYVENQLYRGEIGHGQVIACYGADGREINREKVSEFR